jgi:DNA repair exonuclease SbcCD nuclease subunit
MDKSGWKGDKLSIANLSDIHLGHGQTSTVDIISRLKLALPDDSETATLDLIIISGDLFDTVLSYSDPILHLIHEWMVGLLRLCRRHDIQLRVLEGTPSHDRGQPRHFETLNEFLALGADLKYVDTLSVELNTKLGISILYIPDEWEANPDDTWEQAKEVVSSHGLEKVDFAVMHGMFEYQLPAHLTFTHHKSDRYLELVRGYIFIGHVHNTSTYERILVPGSFDRLCHGEEENKGHWRVKTDLTFTDDEIVFVVNKLACPYVEIDLLGLGVAEATKLIKKHITEVNEYIAGGYSRPQLKLKFESTSEMSEALGELRREHPLIGWKSKPITPQTKDALAVSVGEKYQSVEVNSNNLENMLMEELSLLEDDPIVIQRAMDLIAQHR